MGGARSTVRREEIYTQVSGWRTLTERGYVEDLRVDVWTMERKEIEWEGLDWIYLAHGRD
jgi:hypothetical protein